MRTGSALSAVFVLSLVGSGLGCSASPPKLETSQIKPAQAAVEPVAVLDPSAIQVADEPVDSTPRLAKADEEPVEANDPPRIGALGPHTWIYKKPDRDGLAMGKLRNGTSVELMSTEPVQTGHGCKGKWYSIKPRGFVCADSTATLDLADPNYRVLHFSAPAPGVWPYRYAHSNGAPMYSRVPTQVEWEKQEREYGPINSWKPLGAWAKGHEELISNDPIVATDEVPYFLRDGKRTAPGGNFNTEVLVWRRVPPGSMLSYSRAFEENGRVWLLTPDAMVVPADRVSQQRRSSFHGIDLTSSEMHLPFAWNRSKEPIHLYKRVDNDFTELADTLGPKSPVEIVDGAPVMSNKIEFYELSKQSGVFIRHDPSQKLALDNPVSFTRAATKLPQGIAADEKWIEVKIVYGTLTAYVGDKPIYSTLFSPGKGGPPKAGNDATKYATTSTGFFPLEWKEHVATMSNEKGVPKVLWFTDVPNQQYLKAPLAMHVAYWHEDFGMRKSAECVNVSPQDGNFLFGWTEPKLPEGWNAVGAGQGNGKSTPVIVTAN